MPNQHTVSLERDAEIFAAVQEHGSINKAAEALEIARATAQAAVKRYKKQVEQSPTLTLPSAPDLPDDDISVEEIMEMMAKRFNKRLEHHKAKQWRTFDVPVQCFLDPFEGVEFLKFKRSKVK